MSSGEPLACVARKDEAAHYVWGTGCGGWRLVQNTDLSVIYERMPPGTAEVRHFHQRARQFFWILAGTAEFEIAGESRQTLRASEGLEVPPQAVHRIANVSDCDVEFLVISQPSTQEDRITL